VRSQELGIDNISTRTGNLWIALSLKAFPLKGILNYGLGELGWVHV